jgi:hypothetical protein
VRVMTMVDNREPGATDGGVVPPDPEKESQVPPSPDKAVAPPEPEKAAQPPPSPDKAVAPPEPERKRWWSRLIPKRTRRS